MRVFVLLHRPRVQPPGRNSRIVGPARVGRTGVISLRPLLLTQIEDGAHRPALDTPDPKADFLQFSAEDNPLVFVFARPWRIAGIEVVPAVALDVWLAVAGIKPEDAAVVFTGQEKSLLKPCLLGVIRTVEDRLHIAPHLHQISLRLSPWVFGMTGGAWVVRMFVAMSWERLTFVFLSHGCRP